jgi:hypothetical protein
VNTRNTTTQRCISEVGLMLKMISVWGVRLRCGELAQPSPPSSAELRHKLASSCLLGQVFAWDLRGSGTSVAEEKSSQCTASVLSNLAEKILQSVRSY